LKGVDKMAVDKTKNDQILVTFPKDLVKEIETYWHENKLKNRNEAIRELVQIGLQKKPTE
jgi:metal-responsive CopG/Arc/MetJ family transcriptional regulator